MSPNRIHHDPLFSASGSGWAGKIQDGRQFFFSKSTDIFQMAVESLKNDIFTLFWAQSKAKRLILKNMEKYAN